MPHFETGIGELESQLLDAIGELGHVGTEFVGLGALVGHESIPTGQLGLAPRLGLLGRLTAIVGALDECSQFGDLTVEPLGREHAVDRRLPPVGPLEPQPADLVDELGERTGGETAPEGFVAFDRSSDRPQRPVGNPIRRRGGPEERLQRVGDLDRRAALLTLGRHEDGERERRPEPSMLQFGR